MKKLFLFFVMFSLVCNLPVFAKKLITNDEKDRIVPSRCIGADESEYTDDVYIFSSDYSEAGYQADIYDAVYKPLLEQDLRTELIGTSWNYPSTTPNKSNNFTSTYAINPHKKHYLREAADYYMYDSKIKPRKLIQAGYDLNMDY